MPSHWLVKSEPGTYSIGDLRRDKRAAWEGIRNHQARNNMRDLMKVGDRVLFYHSGDQAAVAGVAKVCSKPHADASALDRRSESFDPKSTAAEPTWVCVDLEYVGTFKREVTLKAIKADARLKDLPLLKNSRLSVQPVPAEHYRIILDLAGGVAK